MSVCIILLHLFTHTTHHPSLIYKSSNKKECTKSSCPFSAGFSSYVVDVLDVSTDTTLLIISPTTQRNAVHMPRNMGKLITRNAGRAFVSNNV
jgi:hypothetical protein